MSRSEITVRQETHNGALSIALSPSGKLYLIENPTRDSVGLNPSIEKSLRDLFLCGEGHGLLHLGTSWVDKELPPVLDYWRNFGRLFVTHLCSVPGIESKRDTLTLPFPSDELNPFLDGAPPMTGHEYLKKEVLESLWKELELAFQVEIKEFKGPIQLYLEKKSRSWNLVGRVCFHLAEQKNNEKTPFAFLATYTTKISREARAQHAPLGRALQEYAGEGNKKGLLDLLMPVQKATSKSSFLKKLVDSGHIYHPLGWAPQEAYQFLKDIPHFEEAGIVVRVPDWWKSKRPPRPQVSITIGNHESSRLGQGSLLDFSMNLALDGETLSEEEWNKAMVASSGLTWLRGQWVEVDQEKLKQVLDHWKSVKAMASSGKISFSEGMRLLAGVEMNGRDGAHSSEFDSGGTAEWSRVQAGDWLEKTLTDLRNTEKISDIEKAFGLQGTLRPYQKVGVEWLWTLNRLGWGGCLADDMGLGKTIQVLTLFLRVKKTQPKNPCLLVVPASLLANWMPEAQKFAPSLKFFVAHPSESPSKELQTLPKEKLSGVDVVMTTYGSLSRFPLFQENEWELMVLDEAQAIKNPASLQTRSAKSIKSRVKLVLTGTPIENSLSDLWSLFDFLNPGLLGSSKTFGMYVKQLSQGDQPNPFAPLRRLVKPYILRRLKSDKSIISDLPDKTEIVAYCSLTKMQAALYQQSVDSLEQELERLDDEEDAMKKRGIILAYLMRFKQICNHPSQWLRDGSFAPEKSGKFHRLRELCEEIRAKQEKVLVFTQFREMTEPLAHFLGGVFGQEGLVLSGETSIKKRQAYVQKFQEEQGPPFFVLSLKAGGTGLNLTAASHVIHFDRWWNPAVENQATDRAYRIGQKKNVMAHKFVCRGTLEDRINGLIESKKGLSQEILSESAEAHLTEMSTKELMKIVALDLNGATEED